MAVSFEYMRWYKAVNKVRWLGLSLVCCTLLLSALFLFVSRPMLPVAAATPETAAQLSTIAFSTSAYTVSEAVGSGEIVLLVDPPSSTPVSITVFSGNIQAEGGKDFEGLRGALVISPSESVYTLSLTILDDVIVEGDEQLRLTLGDYGGVEPGVITETVVTIEDNDVAYLGIGDVEVNEEAGSVSLLVTQSVTSTLQSVVDIRTHEGTATSPEDFVALFTNVVIPPGSTTATVTVQLNGDEEIESTESFIVALEDPTNAEIANMTATVTLIDDDVFPEIGFETAEANEEDGLLPFVITLSSTWAQTVTVEYATADGSAIAPADYLTNTGVLTIAPGSMTATVGITLVDDQLVEPDETLFLVFANPVQAFLSSTEVEGIIHNGDGGGFSEFLFLPGLAR